MKKAKSKANKQTKECRRNRGLKIFNAKDYLVITKQIATIEEEIQNEYSRYQYKIKLRYSLCLWTEGPNIVKISVLP